MSSKFLLIREVLTEAARTGRPEITRRGDVEATFGSIESFLLALHHRWRTALFARVDNLLEDAPADFDAAVVAAWTDPTTGGRGLRALLDAHADSPALSAAQERERRLVRQTLGVEVPSPAPRPRAVAHPAARRWWRGAA
ncbi:hypothetical protein FHX44_117210 [Pseudonocardia hierapolitana]|uniref:Uncharacterized protein n=1 Tax=Pseudonocardia hierapolitana TaxID=1128676 RepID=A0A561T2C5_9PSEU|nr:hypothetical protein [Pseudonocardia hierapolitana]TWF81267.1 hypothetical protein FHX44_117210 [Pseudonocardia hierapolitana]